MTAIALLLWPHSARTEPDARFEPPSLVEQAQTRYVRAKKLFQAKQYAAAAEEFAAAYELDPQSKFLLFNVGVARRMAGSCQGAIEAYRAFLDASPPGQLGDNARIGIERCEKIVASLPPAPPEPAKPEPAKPELRVDAPAAPLLHATPSQIVSQPREPWYHDRAGDALAGGGAGLAIASVTLYLLARRHADATVMPRSLADYEANRTEANQFQIASAITGAAGAVLVVLGVVHYATRPPPHELAIAPMQGGTGLSLGGRF